MDPRNIVRRVDWLWRQHHPLHGEGDEIGDTLVTIIERIDQVEGSGSLSGSGAYIHLIRSSVQSIASGGEEVEWEQFHILSFEFGTPTFPLTEVTVVKAGYYSADIRLGWSAEQTGSVSVLRVRNGVETQVWPPIAQPGIWTTTEPAIDFEGFMPAIPFETDDTLKVMVEHDEASAQNLAYATLGFYLVDRVAGSAPEGVWSQFFTAASYGVVWDGTQWWITDSADNANPALFQYSDVGVLLDSSAGWDTDSPTRNRAITWDGSSLWGVGNLNQVSEIDPANPPTILSNFTPTGGTHTGIGWNGTNLFVAERDNLRVYEYTTAGAAVANYPYPGSWDFVDIAWDGNFWWATTTVGKVLRLSANFATVHAEIDGPGSNIRGIHYRSGFLYVMTPTALYRREAV